MIGKWCYVDKNRFCQEGNCQECQLNYFGNGWVEYQSAIDGIDMDVDLVLGKQAITSLSSQ